MQQKIEVISSKIHKYKPTIKIPDDREKKISQIMIKKIKERLRYHFQLGLYGSLLWDLKEINLVDNKNT